MRRISGFLSCKYLGQRQQALSEEQPLPPPPYAAALFILCFVLLLTLTSLKLFDSFQQRATITAEQITIRTGPSDSDTELFELFEGYEVVILRQTKGWSQVKVPGGITGWIPNSTLYSTSGHSL